MLFIIDGRPDLIYQLFLKIFKKEIRSGDKRQCAEECCDLNGRIFSFQFRTDQFDSLKEILLIKRQALICLPF